MPVLSDCTDVDCSEQVNPWEWTVAVRGVSAGFLFSVIEMLWEQVVVMVTQYVNMHHDHWNTHSTTVNVMWVIFQLKKEIFTPLSTGDNLESTEPTSTYLFNLEQGLT